jgi:predicted 2-oxoglutarate/Fe(II)-dependent dioxygenase YbiX
MTDDDDVKSRYDWDAPLFIERRYPGSSTPIHADVGSGELLTYATILYVNDDFEGGEIFFPEVNISLKPEKGSLCIFTGKSGILHGVAEVTSGTRYSIPIFVWDMTADQSYRKIHK